MASAGLAPVFVFDTEFFSVFQLKAAAQLIYAAHSAAEEQHRAAGGDA